ESRSDGGRGAGVQPGRQGGPALAGGDEEAVRGQEREVLLVAVALPKAVDAGGQQGRRGAAAQRQEGPGDAGGREGRRGPHPGHAAALLHGTGAGGRREALRGRRPAPGRAALAGDLARAQAGEEIATP